MRKNPRAVPGMRRIAKKRKIQRQLASIKTPAMTRPSTEQKKRRKSASFSTRPLRRRWLTISQSSRKTEDVQSSRLLGGIPVGLNDDPDGRRDRHGSSWRKRKGEFSSKSRRPPSLVVLRSRNPLTDSSESSEHQESMLLRPKARSQTDRAEGEL